MTDGFKICQTAELVVSGVYKSSEMSSNPMQTAAGVVQLGLCWFVVYERTKYKHSGGRLGRYSLGKEGNWRVGQPPRA